MNPRRAALCLMVGLIVLIAASCLTMPHLSYVLRWVWLGSAILVTVAASCGVARYIQWCEDQAFKLRMADLAALREQQTYYPQYYIPGVMPVNARGPEPTPQQYVPDMNTQLRTVMVLDELNRNLITQEEADKRIKHIRFDGMGLKVIKGGKESI